MSIEAVILALSWIITGIALVLLVPKNKIREAHLTFLFKQLLTWISGLVVAEYRLITYPVRLFPNATHANFTFEFFIYPALCVFFNLYYPEGKSVFRRALHYILFCSGITVFEVLLKEYTNLIVYVRWTWYFTWITLFLTFLLSRLYYFWFFKGCKKGA